MAKGSNSRLAAEKLEMSQQERLWREDLHIIWRLCLQRELRYLVECLVDTLLGLCTGLPIHWLTFWGDVPLDTVLLCLLHCYLKPTDEIRSDQSHSMHSGKTDFFELSWCSGVCIGVCGLQRAVPSNRPCFRAPQMGTFLGHQDWLEPGTHPSRCRVRRRISYWSRRTLGCRRQRHDRMLRLNSGNALAWQYPRSSQTTTRVR